MTNMIQPPREPDARIITPAPAEPGRIVRYGPDSHVALVTGTNRNGTVNLRVFLPLGDATCGVRDVPFSEEPAVHRWHWPEIAPRPCPNCGYTKGPVISQ